MSNYEEKLNLIDKSTFRNSFHLKEKDILYVKEKGLDKIRSHAYDFINNRLKPKVILNDGKQTPTHGHPVFIAEHHLGFCCRSCLYKLHHIDKNRELTNVEVDYIVDFIMYWINKEINKRS